MKCSGTNNLRPSFDTPLGSKRNTSPREHKSQPSQHTRLLPPLAVPASIFIFSLFFFFIYNNVFSSSQKTWATGGWNSRPTSNEEGDSEGKDENGRGKKSETEEHLRTLDGSGRESKPPPFLSHPIIPLSSLFRPSSSPVLPPCLNTTSR